MKKFYSLLVAAAMVLGATSCQKDATEEVVVNEPVSFTATLNATRTELGEGNKVMWNANDKITIYTQENTAGVVFDGDATEATATATFTTTSEFAASETGYLAVYPELKYDLSSWPAKGTVPAATYADGVYSVPVNIGVEQDVVANGWDEKYNYMVAYSQDNKLAFQAATALIKFTYTGYNGMNLDFYAEGANLAGEATLNYNTADGSISYTTTGTTTNITLFGLMQGETYYIPIYPGKVEYFHLRGTGATGNYENFYSLEGEFEFKAGKIYTVKAKEQGVPSPYYLVTGDMNNMSQMVIEEGYHVAKAVSFNESGYCFFDGENAYTASKEITLNEWQATKNGWTEEYKLIPFASNWEFADIYLSKDASMMCVVLAGAEVPAMPEPFVPEATAWSLVGTFNDWGNAGADIAFYTTETANLYLAANVELTAYAEIKIRKDNTWTTTFGGGNKYCEPEKYVTIWDNGSNFAVTKTGVYDIYFEYSGNGTTAKMYIVSAGADYTTATAQTEDGPKPNPTGVTFGIAGNHNGWGNDNIMTYDEALNAYVAKGVALNGTFKIRGNKDWNSGYNIGALSTSTVTVGKGLQVQNNGNSGNLTVAKGTYDVYYSYAKDMLWVMNVGEVPADL